VSELAAQVGLSTAHLAEVFSREVGVPPFRYLVERRVERAAELLRGTDLPITAIALELGFASSSHFSRVFKQLASVPPREFRRTARGNGSGRSGGDP
jgi:AraC-like DNA-binding protein